MKLGFLGVSTVDNAAADFFGFEIAATTWSRCFGPIVLAVLGGALSFSGPLVSRNIVRSKDSFSPRVRGSTAQCCPEARAISRALPRVSWLVSA